MCIIKKGNEWTKRNLLDISYESIITLFFIQRYKLLVRKRHFQSVNTVYWYSLSFLKHFNVQHSAVRTFFFNKRRVCLSILTSIRVCVLLMARKIYHTQNTILNISDSRILLHTVRNNSRISLILSIIKFVKVFFFPLKLFVCRTQM